MLDLPISAGDALRQIVMPALQLLPEAMDSTQAEVMLLAIALQESALNARQQFHGPAHGLWQNEPNGVSAILSNVATRPHALDLCAKRGVAPNTMDVYVALLTDDILAAGFARLLLWADPHALPSVTDAEGGWATYLRCWRPGKPRHDDWAANWNLAAEAMS